MKKLFITAIFVSFSFINVNAQNEEYQLSLIGTWEIDLRPTPDAEPYIQYLVINEISETSLKGTFYGSSLKDALVNKKFDNIFLAFSTKDQSSTYYHFIKLIDDNKIEGLTYCNDRNLIQPWKGQKME